MAEVAQLARLASNELITTGAEGLTLATIAAAVKVEHERTNTTRAYRADWQAWLAFCADARAHGTPVSPIVPDSDALLVFAKWLATGAQLSDGSLIRPHAPESIRRRITGVLAGWRENEVSYHRGISQAARKWIGGHQAALIEANKPTGRGQAAVLEIDDAKRIAATTPGPTQRQIAALRDLALVFVGFAIGARASELAFLDVTDIAPGERGIYVHVRKSKTKPRRPAVIYGQYESTCPVVAWRRWQQTSGITDGPAFRHVDRHGKVRGRLSPAACSDIVTRAGQRAGLDLRLTGHSLRAGFATAATRAKKDPHDIAAQAGWAPGSEAMHRYIRAVKVWDDNVLAGIGL